MAAKFRPSEVSRESVQVELRDSTSISPDCSAVKRSFADSGLNFTLLASLKMAAAMARQKSTSKPVQFPLSSGLEKPGRPCVTPQISAPRSITFFRVCAVAAPEKTSDARTTEKTAQRRFTTRPLFMAAIVASAARQWRGHRQTLALAG